MIRKIATSPKSTFGQIRTFILSVQVLWSAYLVICCLLSPFFIWYAGLLLLSCGIFYFCDTIILPINTVLDIIKSHEHGTLCVFGKGKTLGNAVVAKVQPSEQPVVSTEKAFLTEEAFVESTEKKKN